MSQIRTGISKRNMSKPKTLKTNYPLLYFTNCCLIGERTDKAMSKSRSFSDHPPKLAKTLKLSTCKQIMNFQEIVRT